jgi:phage-related minor tail protein
MYKPRNKKETTAIFEELITLPRDEADEVMRFVFDRPFAFMYADTGTGELYKNFDRIGISNAATKDQEYSVGEKAADSGEETGTHTSGR